jgi:hypothetical protein
MVDPTLMIALVLLAHLWGDFLLQTDHVARHKAHCWRAMATHLATYHLPVAAVCLWAWGASGRTAAFLLVSAVTHGFLDRRWPVRRLAVLTGSKAFVDTTLGAMIVDQVLHLTVLVVALAVLLG